MKTNKCIVTQDFTCSGMQLASLESRSQIFLGRYLSPTSDARWLPRGERNFFLQKKVKSSSGYFATLTEILLNKWRTGYCCRLHARVLNSAWNTLPVSMCHPRGASLIAHVISKEVICGFASVDWLCSFIVLLGGSSLTLRTQPAPCCCVLSFRPGLLEKISASRISRQSTKLPWRPGTSSLFSRSSLVLSWGKKNLFHACKIK